MGQRKYTFLLLGATLIWGGAFIVVRQSIDAGFSPSFILLSRFIIAVTIMTVILRKKIPAIRRADLKDGLAAGVLLFGGFSLQTVAMGMVSPASNAFITASNSVLVPFLCWMLFRKRPLHRAFVGAVLCFVGVWILSAAPGEAVRFGLGEVVTFLGALCFASHTTGMGLFAGRGEVEMINYIQMCTAMVLSFVFFMATDRDFTQFVPQMRHLSLVYLGVLSTCLACFIQAVAQKHLHPSKISVIIATESLFASLFSVAFGYDMLRASLLFGGMLILTSILVVEADWDSVFQRFGPKKLVPIQSQEKAETIL